MIGTTKDYYPFNQHIFDMWMEDKKKKGLRVNYPELGPNSIVIDCGGFLGEWAKTINSRYNCRVIIFEPLENYSTDIKNMFKSNNLIEVVNFGVAKKAGISLISKDSDASSIHKGNGNIKIETRNLLEFMEERDIERVDLLKLNIEGSEYEVLEDILEKKEAVKFTNIQVQFHRFIENCYKRREMIREKLSITHELTYDYEFIWENWKLKK